MNLASLDLNLLIVLDAILQHRSVTRAAQQLHLSQPAVSASLARLRRHFGDELLARSGNDYRLTPLAVELKDRAHLALASVDRVFDSQRDFDSTSTTREFSMIVSDYVVAILGSAVAELLAKEAPQSRLKMSAINPHMVSRANQVLLGTDILIVPHGSVYDLCYEDLYQDDWLGLVAVDNPLVGAELTLQHMETLPWVQAFHGPAASTPAALQMRLRGLVPIIKITTESFLTIPALISGSDRIALLQRRLVGILPESPAIRAVSCPVEIGPLIEAMWWHPVRQEDPEHAYFRDVLRRAARGVFAGGGAKSELTPV